VAGNRRFNHLPDPASRPYQVPELPQYVWPCPRYPACCDHSCEMKLIQNRTVLGGVIMMTVTIGGFALSEGIAKASVIPISFTTTGTFSAGTPSDLSYTATSFTGTTTTAGFLLLPDLGQFNLNGPTDPQRFNGDSFTLHLNFLTPLGVSGSIDFVASLSGHINVNGNGNVHVNFTPNSKVIAFANDTGSGTFSLAVNDVIGLQQSGAATPTGSVANAVVVPPTVAPEPDSFILLGSALIGLSCTVRRKGNPASDRRPRRGLQGKNRPGKLHA
jgi:hypothetical protein